MLGDRFIHLKHLRHTHYPGLATCGNLCYDVYGYNTENRELLPNGECWLQIIGDKNGVGLMDNHISDQLVNNHDDEWIRRIAKEGLQPDSPPWRIDSTAESVYSQVDEMHLSILRTCRQIYHEAHPILWGTNIFSFSTANCFERFFDGRTPEQKAALKMLHLIIDVALPCTTLRWNVALSKSLMRSMKGLSNLHLVIQNKIDVSLYREHKSTNTMFLDPRWAGVLRLSMLPLQDVDLTMKPSPMPSQMYTGPGTLSEAWAQSEIDEYGELLKGKISETSLEQLHIRAFSSSRRTMRM